MIIRMNRCRMNIGAYHLKPYARTEKHIKELSDCGIDFVVCMENDRPALDLFHKYGVGAILSGIVPSWWGGDGDNAGKLEETYPLEKYDQAAADFEDHPAVWGIDVGDEPSALDFPYYGKVIDRVNQLFPNQFAYLNLYPNYASVSQNSAQETVNQLGTSSYEEHIQQYCKYVPSDYLCYDFYLYSINVPKAYENLRVVADACQRTGREMWIVLQVNSNKPAEWITENQLRFQAYTAMAFGAENLIWACYTAGWWHNQVLDEEGNKTQQYDKLRRVNKELHILGEEYMRYRRVSTHFVGFSDSPWLEGVDQEPIDQLSTGVFQNLHGADNGALVVGQMVSREEDGSYALMICAADDPYDRQTKKRQICFQVDGREVIAIGGEGKLPVSRSADGSMSVEVASNAGVLLIAR